MQAQENETLLNIWDRVVILLQFCIALSVKDIWTLIKVIKWLSAVIWHYLNARHCNSGE